MSFPPINPFLSLKKMSKRRNIRERQGRNEKERGEKEYKRKTEGRNEKERGEKE